MGFVSGLLGIGNTGGKFRADSANLLQGVDTNQTGQAYGQAQTGLQQQQAFLQALQAQNGIGNQANVFAQQQALANQLQGVANGTGPNPALQQLQNTTGQNVANQAALMAGQRGSSANSGLLARQAGMQGANIQQQAVGQGAALSAQQQIAAMQALQGQQQMMGNLAGTQVAQQGSALTGYNQAAQSEQQGLLNALGQYNNANVSNVSQRNQANAGIQGQVAKGQNDILGGLIGGLGASFTGKAHGGLIKGYADGGEVGPQSFAGKFFNGFSSGMNQQPSTPTQDPYQNVMSSMSPGLERGTAQGVAGAISGIGRLFAPAQSMSGTADMSAHMGGAGHAVMSRGGAIDGEMLAAQGKMVPGKASVKGDSLKNDKVPAVLSPGEVVIPRSVMSSADPVSSAAKFVQAILAKNGPRRRA